MAAGVTIAEQPSESGEMGSCAGGCLAHAPCELHLGELESLESSVALAAERVGRVGISRNPPRAGGGGESGESVAAKGR
eukprot:1040290-Prymnesium_polylepis.1